MIDLVFLHIPKTAGRTLVQHLAGQYSGHEIVNVSRDALRRRGQSLEDHVTEATRVLAGHLFYRDVEQFLHPGTRLVTFLREPVARVLSNYHHVVSVELPRQRRERPLGLARRRFHDILSLHDSRSRGLLELALRPWRLWGALRLEQWIELRSTQNLMCRYVTGCPLEKFWFIGFQERFREDLRRLADRLDWNNVDESIAVNVGRHGQNAAAIPHALGHRIRELNGDDLRLFRQAGRLWGFDGGSGAVDQPARRTRERARSRAPDSSR